MNESRVLASPSLVPLVAMGMIVLVIIGSIAPWARVSGEAHIGGEIPAFSINGTDADGIYTLILAVVAGVLVLWRIVRPGLSGFVLGTASLLLLICSPIGVGNWMLVERIRGPEEVFLFQREVAVAWGLIMVTLASFPALVCAGYQLWDDELR